MSTSETNQDRLCREVEERMTDVLDGTAPGELMDHVADCDICRDARYEAERAAAVVKKAGADFQADAGFADRILARIDVEKLPAPTGAVPRSLTSAPSSNVASKPASTTRTEAPISSEKISDRQAIESAKTEVVAPVRNDTLVSEKPSEKAPVEASEAGSSRPTGTLVDSAAPAHAVTQPEEPASRERPKAVEKAPEIPKPAQEAKVVPLFRRPKVVAGVLGTLAAAAAVGLYMNKSTDQRTTETPKAPEAVWTGKVEAVSRASADKTGGLEACDSSNKCAPLAAGGEVKSGMTLRTDARTRAHVSLADGSVLSLDRGSSVSIQEGKDRVAKVESGSVVADVAWIKGATPARFAFGAGEVEVLGTKLMLTANNDRANVEVARGKVRAKATGGKWTEVRAGEEVAIEKGRELVVASSASVADSMEWSDRSPEELDAPVLRGVGELKARKPGQTTEKERAVRLAKHSVKVRVVDVVARTEIDETFTNDTDEELEGIYRFPLPPGAQIERLALEVDGKLMEGAFVDRDKGAAIWRGVIQNAAPKTPKPKEEIIWVAGPWRDPALLEWQRGGRFELKIFPIPRKGSRRVILAYTQTVDQAAGVRRFTYPLAHDPSGTTKIDSFDLDLQVLGHDKSFGLQTRGYELASASGDTTGDRKTFQATNFVPAGDLTVEYALPDRDREATAWAYKMDQTANVEPPRPPNGPATAKGKTTEEKDATEAAKAIAFDSSPYVAIAVRPKLPRWQEAKERVHAIIVDTSRSMFGERFARATRLASTMVREMDRRDTFVVLACDTVCKPMTPDAKTSFPTPMAPSAAAAGDVERFLGGIEPDGGSDMSASVSAARSAVGSLGSKELRIIYLGDGTPTVGPTRPPHIEAGVRSSMPGSNASIVAVALGADADMNSLGALARGGGGVVIPYVPGQKVSSAALDVLSAAYGVTLRDTEIELPPGLTQVTPTRLDPIRAGGETFVVARMSSGEAIDGSIRLRGKVADERFEQTYPIKIVASTSSGNAFVPRLYAAAKIAEMERTGGQGSKLAAIELSKRFAVASRFTSLLVLESEAMMNAFGLERNSVAPSFTGEVSAQSSTADAENEAQLDEEAKKEDATGALATADALGDSDKASAESLGKGAGGFAPPAPASPAPTTASPAKPAGRAAPMDAFESAPAAEAPPPPPKVANQTRGPWGDRDFDDGGWGRRRRLVAMKKIFERKASFEATNTLATQNAPKLLLAESELSGAPNSRDKTVNLFALYSTSGRIGEAQELTSKWASRDALDPDALLARSDLAARQGDRDRAIRILGGLADVRPGDRAIQTRLASLHEASGNRPLACEHRIALADMASDDAKLVAEAIRCANALGMNDLATLLRLDASSPVRTAIDKLLEQPAPTPNSTVTGDIQATAEWTGGVDLDIGLIDAQGRRTSWLGAGGKALVSSRDVTSTRAETIGLTNALSGSYVIEVARASGTDANIPVRGELTLKLAGETRKVPFLLTGQRAEVGTMRVFFTSRLVPL
jgi:ferric-dicitrate binding protein FerR (iron transport regulator)